MVLIKIALVGALVAALLVLGKQEHVFERAGVVGTCKEIPAPGGDHAQWWACSQGILTGFPTLPQDACDYESTAAGKERWSCAEPLTSIPGF